VQRAIQRTSDDAPLLFEEITNSLVAVLTGLQKLPPEAQPTMKIPNKVGEVSRSTASIEKEISL
jgi:hypothetical protein